MNPIRKTTTIPKNGSSPRTEQSHRAERIHLTRVSVRIELPSGEVVLLKALLDAFPEETLGSAHVDKYGTELGVLLKIFDVGEGAHIPIHWHPNPEFSKEHLNSPFGKNEAWILIGTRPGAKAWIG